VMLCCIFICRVPGPGAALGSSLVSVCQRCANCSRKSAVREDLLQASTAVVCLYENEKIINPRD
jgi:hypothetical protein